MIDTVIYHEPTGPQDQRCVDLLRTFGGIFRITWDEAYSARGVPKRSLDVWCAQIPCAGRGVTISPHGGSQLALECDHRPSIARKVAALPGVVILQDGGSGGEMTFLFDIALWDEVAAIARPRRRRRLSEEQKAACQERLRRVRPQKPT